ncbi:cation:dicarboxylase symporter family transporter [Allosphingosinicella flava]|uniref:Cation:dicarboxylase symporter family transporter n=1 Tax=Allosphingosinicella flava TaxID=2771430 RepID=A0A7T2LM27_9SPHN|nr:cation:dicarboxylase symporter family transporter [Sphingosinicella flava]QPQ55135.1 cation:dicarboxylase symporter family transporter [Sphingosinicella flava]
MSQPTRILAALVLGLSLGLFSASAGVAWLDGAVSGASLVGGLWLNALQMTIVPLVVSLLVTGIAATAKAARASKVAGRALVLFIILLWISAAIAAVLTPMILDAWPLPRDAADGLRSAIAGSAPVGEVPSLVDFFRSIVPTNPVAAAANDAFLPLILFTLVFAFALTRIPDAARDQLIGFFRAVSDVMLVMIGWILWLAPIGVLALAYAVGARAGTAAFGALVHYVIVVSAVGIVVWALAYPLALIGARTGLATFARAVAPSQAVAISTQSSLASLPAMLRGTERLGVPVALSGVVLPMAVAIFRVTGPAMNLAVAFYVAHLFGIELGPGAIAAGIAAAATTTLGAVSLPGQVSFITSIAPICIVMGIPIEPLALLIAVETVPDIFRTLGNVTMDVAATATVAKRSGVPAEVVESEQDALIEAGMEMR